MKLKLILTASALVLFTGCASTSKPDPFDDAQEWKTKAYETKIKPQIGSRQDDSRVVLDVGRVQKIWVAPYKQSRTLIAAHDIYAIVKKPSFIMGEMVPSGKRTGGAVNCDGDFPFMFRDSSIETVRPEDRFKDSNIKSYANNVYKAQSDPKYYDKKKKEADGKFDKTIKDYIK